MTTIARPHRPNVADYGVDLAAQAFWAQPFSEREPHFARLRAEAPVAYSRPYESTMLPPEDDTPGFWSVTKFEDCREVSRDTSRFISGEGTLMEQYPEVVRVGVASFLMMDGEEHRQLRGIVSSTFTPRNVRRIEDWIHQHAVELVDELLAGDGAGDFNELFAKRLPGRIFAHFFGVERDSEDMYTLMDAAEKMLAWDDPEAQQGRDALTTHADEAMRIQEIALDVAERRRLEPKDDMISWLVTTEFEGRQMEDFEIASFCSLLASAANDTTRHSTAHAIRLLSEHPDQRALLVEDLGGRVERAVEEILRYSSPVMHFRRTAIVDTEIRGVPISAGDSVVMWYCSGNYDDDVYVDPRRFSITREPNRHLAFGAGGPHFCIGSALVRQMLKSALIEIYTRIPDIDLACDVVFQQNNFIHGVRDMPVRWDPGRVRPAPPPRRA
jgi:cytochrome P450